MYNLVFKSIYCKINFFKSAKLKVGRPIGYFEVGRPNVLAVWDVVEYSIPVYVWYL